MGAGDYYKILKVRHDATDEELKKAYKKLAMMAQLRMMIKTLLGRKSLRPSSSRFLRPMMCSVPKKRQLYDFYGDHYPIESNSFSKENGDGNMKHALVSECSLLCILEDLYNGYKKKY